MSNNQESKDALKTTGAVGGGQLVNIIIGLIKVKFTAVILGPSGVGIVGLLTTTLDMIRSFSGLGLTFSGVREISMASAKDDEVAVAKTVRVFNTWVFITALLGTTITLVFCVPISRLLFKNDQYAIGIAFLSISIFFTAIAAGWTAIMQGRRAVAMMVKSGIYANVLSAVIVIIVYLILKEKGIVPSFIITSLVSVCIIFYFYKKLDIPAAGKLQFAESWNSAKGMIKIGVFTIVVSVFDQLMSLGLRSFISHKTGVEGVGLLTAATTIAGFYLNIVLSSLGTDYYPKLAAIQEDNTALNKSVNAQLYIILLLACPLIIGMVGFGNIVVDILYSNKFHGAIPILKWQILGDFFKIISWPCGYVFLAKGLGRLYVSYSIAYTVLNMAIIYFGWPYMGFLGIGISFFIAQFCAVVFTYTYCYFKFGIHIHESNRIVIILGAVALTAAFLSHEYLEGISQFITSFVILAGAVVYSIYKLDAIVNIKGIFNKYLKR